MTALRTLTQARIACSNSVSELETLNAMSDDWHLGDERVRASAIDLHIQSEFAAKEADSIHSVLTGFATSGTAASWLWMEIEVRQENAAAAAKEIGKVIEGLATFSLPEFGLSEMKRGVELIQSKLDGLEDILARLQVEAEPNPLQQSDPVL